MATLTVPAVTGIDALYQGSPPIGYLPATEDRDGTRQWRV